MPAMGQRRNQKEIRKYFETNKTNTQHIKSYEMSNNSAQSEICRCKCLH